MDLNGSHETSGRIVGAAEGGEYPATLPLVQRLVAGSRRPDGVQDSSRGVDWVSWVTSTSSPMAGPQRVNPQSSQRRAAVIATRKDRKGGFPRRLPQRPAAGSAGEVNATRQLFSSSADFSWLNGRPFDCDPNATQIRKDLPLAASLTTGVPTRRHAEGRRAGGDLGMEQSHRKTAGEAGCVVGQGPQQAWQLDTRRTHSTIGT